MSTDGKKKSDERRRKQQFLRCARILVQLIAFIFAPALFSQAFGAVKEVAATMGKGDVLDLSDFVIRLLILCGVTILLGRVFCGWLCAFGALNDWVYQLSAFLQKKTGKKLPKLSEPLIPVLQKMKYFVLVLTLILCFLGQSSFVTKNSPWTVFSLITAGNFSFAEYGTGCFFCVLLLLGMAVHERFFCQFFCPMGAVFSLLPELPLLHRDEKSCIPNCQACRKNCPVHIKLGEDSFKQGECIRCGRCMLICPRKNIGVFRMGNREFRKTESEIEKKA